MRLHLLLLGILFPTLPLHAEIVTDGSLGPQLELAGPDYAIGEELGKKLDNNLFHSFSAFNLGVSESATFSGPHHIEHIIGRVTGGEASKIEGMLKSSIPDSQLWMFNPAGWEQLGAIEVLGGLAHAPAEALRLKDGGLFRATDPEQSLLTSAPPAGFLGIRQPELPSDPIEKNRESEGELSIFFADDREARRLEVLVSACELERSGRLSHFYISRYRGIPAGPDEWLSSPVLALP